MNKPLEDDNRKVLLLELSVKEDSFEFLNSIPSALERAQMELSEIDDKISESEKTLKNLTPQCDRIDYILAASSGILCGIIDVFLVGKPGESPFGKITDKWFEERTKDFAKLCKWDGKDNSLKSAIAYLEKKFKVPYDQRGAGDAGKEIFDLSPTNHHFKSLGHNPTLLGLFVSIMDQFYNTSNFITNGQIVSLENADGTFELRGKTIPSKFFCGFVNWIGHLISDASGSSGSAGRGMGIPSPIWSWTNNIIAIKDSLGIPVKEFDKSINELALNIYEKGFDFRFQTAQLIPVFINELIVRTFYSIRRLIRYFSKYDKVNRSFKSMWKECEPFSNATVKRMLTVAHGSFCLIDLGDATIRGFATGGGTFNVVEFAMRINVAGIGRFTISLFGEVRSGVQRTETKEKIYLLRRERTIVTDYISGLQTLAEMYDDQMLLDFTNDLKQSDLYKQAFNKTVKLAEIRNVPENEILRTKKDIDDYFRRR